MLNKRLIVAITGASGTIYGIRILEALKNLGIESHLVMSDSAKLTMAAETDYKPAQIEAMADVVHSAKNVGASISSGSFKSLGMVIAPCSIRTLSEIASGVTSSLVSRAADVALKERRRLVLLVRETPLHAGHLRSMSQVTECGAIVMPPVPAFYAKPESIGDMVNHTVGRCLDLFDLDNTLVTRWNGMDGSK
ncbi:UbiX family flavin prenyltransferase [Polynucleobacter sp. AP-Nickl1-40-C4]|uniref:UbiX family flavin prenyltransferase n=1 Tax=unclassified Polynucleobacter TaxID=2640945 RepID=UPI001C0D3B24|nr:UbiX family flavin prenyltransferase [Polynucleobacter sp. AP-Nickl1-40-C4]MBU3549265.1 UbiX family flavin prenyltransferase [Polynucleobacter sp. P1-05-14]MBU3618616.1 UbiX family flavin prenyltransferase [Polynucleobacter sp. JS-Fieb-80-E5]MEA9567417.1 UbiX family flavin prenyltransferase [Polynucleobacter sp. AP-Nickl1-40-C4]